MSQATVRTWEPGEGGSAFLDDGQVVELPAEALSGSPFRFLRPGQRVQLLRDEQGLLRVDLPVVG